MAKINFDLEDLRDVKLDEIRRSDKNIYRGMLGLCAELEREGFAEAAFLLSGSAKTPYALGIICKRLSKRKDRVSKKKLKEAERMVMAMNTLRYGGHGKQAQPKGEETGAGGKKPFARQEEGQDTLSGTKKKLKDCNGMDLEKDRKAVKAYKKPVVLKFGYAEEDTTVQTKEGPVSCKKGDAILTGTQGEQWPIPREKFEQTYDVVGDGQCAKKKIEVMARQMGVPFTVKVSWSADPLVGAKGDWLVQYGKGDFGIVGKQIFAETYAIVGQK